MIEERGPTKYRWNDSKRCQTNGNHAHLSGESSLHSIMPWPQGLMARTVALLMASISMLTQAVLSKRQYTLQRYQQWQPTNCVGDEETSNEAGISSACKIGAPWRAGRRMLVVRRRWQHSGTWAFKKNGSSTLYYGDLRPLLALVQVQNLLVQSHTYIHTDIYRHIHTYIHTLYK